MKCVKCGKTIRGRVAPSYHYKECGLNNVYLKNSVVLYTCSCGEELIQIPTIERLHDAIAYDVLQKRTLLIADEFRFLRKWVGLTAESLAATLGFKKRQTISRYENGREPINAASDHAMRLLVMRLKEQSINQRMFENVSIQEYFERIAEKSSRQKRITIDQEKIDHVPFPATPVCAGT